MRAFIVTHDFIRKNPLTGEAHMHKKGDIVSHPARVSDLDGSEHRKHVTPTHLPENWEHTPGNHEPAAETEAA